MNQTTGYKEAPFDLEIALKNPDWVYFRNGEKPLEWHYFKTSSSPLPILPIDKDGVFRDVTRDGVFGTIGYKHDFDLILRIPTKKMKVTVFVWPNGHTTNYSDYEYNGNAYKHCREQAEQGLCTKHEFEVEVNGQP